MIRIGILGAAKIAPPALIEPASRRDDCTVTAVACSSPKRGESFALSHGIETFLDSYEELIARPDIDLIYNALPPSRHADLTIAALEAGKAVLCEKPFAMNAGEAARMVAAAEATGRDLVEAFHYRYHPAFHRLMDLLAAGSIGDLQRLDASFTVEIPYAEGELRHTPDLGGGALMDLGCYPLHWARTVVGREPDIETAVAVEGTQEGAQGVDLSMTAHLAFGDVMARVHCSMAPGAPRGAYLTLEGTGGTLNMLNPLAPHIGHKITLTTPAGEDVETVEGDTTYDHQLAHMIAVMEGSAQPLTGGRDSIANMAAIDAIYTAAGLSPRGM